jgi:hypothetical protein
MFGGHGATRAPAARGSPVSTPKTNETARDRHRCADSPVGKHWGLCPGTLRTPFTRCGRRLDGNPLMRPLGNRVDGGSERSALPREGVLHTHRGVGDDRPFDDPFLFEFLKTFAEHAVCDVGNGIAQRGKPTPGPQEHKDNRTRPPATDQLTGSVKPRTEFRRMPDRIPRHARSIP